MRGASRIDGYRAPPSWSDCFDIPALRNVPPIRIAASAISGTNSDRRKGRQCPDAPAHRPATRNTSPSTAVSSRIHRNDPLSHALHTTRKPRNWADSASSIALPAQSYAPRGAILESCRGHRPSDSDGKSNPAYDAPSKCSGPSPPSAPPSEPSPLPLRGPRPPASR